jgi:hypothetical protein
MRIKLLVCAVVTLALCTAAGLPAQQDQKKKRDDRPVIVVIGCMERGWLRVETAGTPGSYVSRYKLRGGKQLMREIEKNFNGHQLEVTGAVTDMGNTTHRGKTIAIGKKTRIHTGAKEVSDQPSGSGDPILEVESFRDLKHTCK